MNDSRRRFEEEVLPHLDAAYRFARWLAHSPADADDLVQDAMIRAFRGIDALRGDAKSWLLAIVRNCHSTAHRRRQRLALVPLPEEHDPEDGHHLIANAPDPEAASISRDHEHTLERLLAELPEEHREVLILREIEDMEYREIAAITQAPMGTVMSRLSRARAALKARWYSRAEEATRELR